MRRRTVLASIVLLAGVLLAWRRRARATHASLAPPPSRVRPVALLEPGAQLEAAAPPEQTAEPEPTSQPAPPSQFVSIPWTLATAPEDRGELTLRYASSEQLELDRVDAQETPTQVFVTVLMRWRTPANGSSAAQEEHEAVVMLTSPLGERELVHAPVDLDGPAGGEPDAAPLYP